MPEKARRKSSNLCACGRRYIREGMIMCMLCRMDLLQEPGPNDPTPEQIRAHMLRIRGANERTERLKGARFRSDVKPIEIRTVRAWRETNGVKSES